MGSRWQPESLNPTSTRGQLDKWVTWARCRPVKTGVCCCKLEGTCQGSRCCSAPAITAIGIVGPLLPHDSVFCVWFFFMRSWMDIWFLDRISWFWKYWLLIQILKSKQTINSVWAKPNMSAGRRPPVYSDWIRMIPWVPGGDIGAGV